MCLFTHFAAGALVGGLTGNPVAGLIAGIASHAVLDAIPHYDHPDWRLELAGGVFSLILLLFMPFASLPAILGGLGGMLPDLENLFQKLGKMRRDQFVFPSHTGLIPHGRTLGPRSLVWQAAIFVACFGLLGLVQPEPAGAATLAEQARMAPPVVQVLESSQDLTRIRLDFPVIQEPESWDELTMDQVIWALPHTLDEESGPDPVLLPPQMPLTLAVPTRGSLQVSVSGVRWWRLPDQSLEDAALIEFGAPAIFRTVPLAGGLVKLGAQGGVLRSLTLSIQHTASGQPREQLRLARDAKAAGGFTTEESMMPRGVLNAELFQALAQGGRVFLEQQAQQDKASGRGQFNPFDLTSNWVRLEVDQTGVFRVTGEEMADFGVPASDIDPTSLRVFQGGGLNLASDLSVAEEEQPQRVGLTEVAIQVIDGGDGEWNLDDELRFYGVSASTWTDRLDPRAGRLDHFDHPYSGTGVYWVTWDGLSGGSALPGTPLRVAASAAPALGGQPVTTARLRLHAETQAVEAAGVVEDNWAWNPGVTTSSTWSFEVRQPVEGQEARFVIGFRGHPGRYTSSTYQFAAEGWLNGDSGHSASTSFFRNAQHDSAQVRLFGNSTQLVTGQNSFTFVNTGGGGVPLALDYFDLLYWSYLDMRGSNEPFAFTHWSDEVSAIGTAYDISLTVSALASTIVWDVSNPQEPRQLVGEATGQSPPVLTLGVTRDPDIDLHLVAQDLGQLLEVTSARRVSPVDLRSQDTAVDYLVIFAEPFVQAAQDLADFHDQTLVGVANPSARAVSVQEIYNNFSGGRKDAMAIRNYLKYVYEAEGRLQFACFLGNASRDHRNYLGHAPFVDLWDFIPAELRTAFPINGSTDLRNAPYASDDGLSSFDVPDPTVALDLPDLATGRLPATTVAEAQTMVDLMIEYGDDPPSGMWRNNLLMTSDDCNRPSHYPYPITTEISHMLEAELLTGSYIPQELDIRKIYGVEYDFPPGSLVKPQVRSDINAALNAGTTLFHYVGHGAEDNLADEQIFQSRDIANLTNGLRRPVFVAFSCDVGVYDNPLRRSMAELFIASENGGAIGTICASQVSFISDNNLLSNAFYSSLFPSGQVAEDVTVSQALMAGKAEMSSFRTRRNSQRYTLFSDPGLRLPNPVSDLSFARTSVDTLRSGALQVVEATTGAGGAMLGAGDTYDLRVQESAYDKVYIVYSYYLDYTQDPPRYVYTPSERTFVKLGAPVFRGTGTMSGDDLAVPFKVPAQLRYGDRASVRLVIEGPDGQHGGQMQVPAVRSATGPVDDILGPSIALALPNPYRVRPGDSLNATLTDTSGIAMLGTSPGNSILLEFDNTGFMTEVTESFNYDPNSYTTGRVIFPLPGDISEGKHAVALHASDALGNVGSDTLSFTVAEYGVPGIRDATVFPNPTPGPCRLIFDISDAMDIRWDIYTLSGKRIWTHTASLAEGPQILSWDGQDQEGDEIANGTYLYVLRGTMAASDGRELRQTGKLVIMR